MDAKQFLALNEQMIAINMLMGGQLAKETADAKAALDALGGAKAINKIQAQLDQDKTDFEAYKADAEAQIEKDKATIQAKQFALAEEQAKFASDADALVSEHASLATEKSAFEASKQEQNDAIIKATNDLAIARQMVDVQSNDLSAAQRAVDAREQVVADKLAAMKALV